MVMDDDLRLRDNNRFPLGAKALMVVVAIVTLLAVWLVPSDKEEQQPDLPELPSPELDQTLPLPPPTSDQGDGITIYRAGDKARAIITQLRAGDAEPDSGEVFGYAEQLQNEGQLDDAYLLYRFAARQGHALAALVLGSQADPVSYSPEISILPAPDLEQAYKWYSVAAADGNEEAVTRLQHLRERVEASAAEGNEPAKRLMLQWR